MLGGRIAGHRIIDDRPSCQRIVRNEGLGSATASVIAKLASDDVSFGNIAFLEGRNTGTLPCVPRPEPGETKSSELQFQLLSTN